LFANDGFTLMATSGSIAVSGPPTATPSPTRTSTATPVPASISAPGTGTGGGSATVSWSGSTTPHDWIGVFASGVSNQSIVNWLYTSCSRTPSSTTVGSGSCSFPLPSASTTFYRSLFANDGFTLMATSGSIVVSGAATATPSATPTATPTPGSA